MLSKGVSVDEVTCSSSSHSNGTAHVLVLCSQPAICSSSASFVEAELKQNGRLTTQDYVCVCGAYVCVCHL